MGIDYEVDLSVALQPVQDTRLTGKPNYCLSMTLHRGLNQSYALT